ncbi:MAG: hypothetical protein LUE24_14790 [Lachnospiraceae bacterium]|nr:hypothetical protein [Lachnospiraceae bacterium]
MYYSDRTWSWPEEYYGNQWIANGAYTKNTALSSTWTAFEKQTPSVELTLQSSNEDGDTWQVYLNDPDSALVSHTLLGYNTESKVNSSPIWSDSLLGGVVDATGASVGTQTIGSAEKYIEITVEDTDTNTDTTLSYIDYSDTVTYPHEYDNAYSNKYYAVVEEVTDSATDNVTASDDELAAMKAIVTALKAADESGGTAGATVVCSNIGVGQYYSWRAGCQTIDDYYPSSYRATVTLLGHQYSGTGTMTAGKWSGNVEDDDTVAFAIQKPELDDDNDVAKIFLLREDGTSSADYIAAMRRIAAVEIVVKNTAYATSPVDDNKYTFWSGMTYGLNTSGTYGYYFSFSISDLPSGFYTVGESLTLEYTFYYYNGESSFEVATDGGYYALRSVTYHSDGDYYEQLKSASSTAQLNYSTSASSSIYWFAAGSRGLSRSYATSNSGDVYLTGFTQSWTLSGAPLASWYSDGEVTRTEDLGWGGADLSVGYDAGLVTEFCVLATFTATGSVTTGTLAPVLSSLPVVTSGLTEAKVTVKIGNYGLMDYPDGEDFHLYYLLYEVTDETDSDGIALLELKGAMIGAAIDATMDGSDPTQTITLTDLEPDKTYYLYIYYKDNRGTTEDTKATADSTLFATAYQTYDYTDGTFTTDATVAKLLESTIIATANYPRSNDAYNCFTKISGQGTHLLTSAYTDTEGTVHAATYDYYCIIEPQDGIEISSMKFDLGNDDPYYSTTNGDVSGKTLSCSVTVSYMQDENTVAYFILERCATNLNQSLPSNWKTVLMPEDYYSIVTTAGAESVYCTPAIETSNVLNAGHYEYYATYEKDGITLTSGSDYQYTALAETETGSGVYTASMSLTYYPMLGGVIEPGYVYRMKALVYQLTYDGDVLKSAELVSIDSTDSTQSYSTSQTTWSAYSYSSDNPLINVTNLDWSSNTITCYIKAQTGYYTWLDRTYYVRLCEWDTTNSEWVILADEASNGQGGTIKYGTITSGGTATSIYDYAFGVEDSSTQLTFEGLASDTTYSIQFFGLIDTDYDGYVNIASDGTPLAAEYTTTPTFALLEGWYPTSDSSQDSKYDDGRSSNLSTLNTYYFGDGTNAAEGNLSDILLCQSRSVTTMKAGTTATIGSYYDYNVVSATQLELYFEDAAGLASTSISQIEWTLHYVGITGSQEDRSGTTSSVKNTYSSSTTLTDDVTVTITDSGTNFQQNGHWYFTLKITYADDTEESVDSWEIEFTEF